MTDDPIVEEVRRLRDEYARRFNYDVDAIFADLVARQEERLRGAVSGGDHPLAKNPPVATPRKAA